MKKALAVLLLLVYFTVSTGFVVSLHYCMDRLDSAQIGERRSGTCGRCGMHKGHLKCCWDDVKMVKLQTTHVASKQIVADFSFPTALVLTTEFLVSPFYNYTQTDHSLAHAPPWGEQDTYLRNCVFRI